MFAGSAFIRAAAVVAVVLIHPCSPGAQTSENADRRLRLQFGPNAIDLNKDGRDDLAFVSWRESNNGQGYRILNFFIDSGRDRETFPEERRRMRHAPDSTAPGVRADTLWESVLIEDPDTGLLDPAVAEKESGHCALKRAGLLLTELDGSSEGPEIVLVVVEKRAYRKVFDERAMAVDLYLLERDERRAPGLPTYRFRLVKSAETDLAYCDAEEALDSLLPD